ncbi:hypothetical protein BDW22DRAFT_1420517, partial [Trametopsis cervina]
PSSCFPFFFASLPTPPPLQRTANDDRPLVEQSPQITGRLRLGFYPCAGIPLEILQREEGSPTSHRVYQCCLVRGEGRQPGRRLHRGRSTCRAQETRAGGDRHRFCHKQRCSHPKRATVWQFRCGALLR